MAHAPKALHTDILLHLQSWVTILCLSSIVIISVSSQRAWVQYDFRVFLAWSPAFSEPNCNVIIVRIETRVLIINHICDHLWFLIRDQGLLILRESGIPTQWLFILIQPQHGHSLRCLSEQFCRVVVEIGMRGEWTVTSVLLPASGTQRVVELSFLAGLLASAYRCFLLAGAPPLL